MMFNKNLLNFSPKKKLFIFILLYFVFIFFYSFIFNIDYYQIWKLLGVPAKEYLFSDIYPFFVNEDCKIISNNLRDYYEQFLNCDESKRTFNYMPLWLYVLKFGINNEYHYFFGFTLITLFYISFFKLIKIKSNADLILYALIILSPPIMLAIERGNSDLLIFFLCFISIYLLIKKKFFYNLLGYFLILFSSLIKFFPIFLILIFFKKNYYNKFASFSVLFIFLIYIFFNIEDIFLIKKNTQETLFLSYGFNILEVSLKNFYDNLNILILATKNYLYANNGTFKEVISEILYIEDFKNNYFIISRCISIIIIIFSVVYSFKNKNNEKILINNNFYFFIAGASIFCGTFLLGANFDYRLIFLLLTVPYLIEQKKNFIYLLILYFWISPISIFTLGLDDILSWILFIFFINYLSTYYISLVLNKKS